jgi:hypothetical protein
MTVKAGANEIKILAEGIERRAIGEQVFDGAHIAVVRAPAHQGHPVPGS